MEANMAGHRLGIIAWILAICMIQTPANVPAADILNRKVALDRAPRTSADAISLLLAEAHAPGGMISIHTGCASPNPHVFLLEETSLKQGLDYVSSVDPIRNWAYVDGHVEVGLDQAENTILKTIIQDVEILPEDPLSLSTQRLFQTPEVQSSIQRAKLSEITAELGFSKISKDPKPASSESQASRIHRTSLLDALNTLATTQTAVWEYDQFTCNNKAPFRVNWVVN
jgi:hypothetical protein